MNLIPLCLFSWISADVLRLCVITSAGLNTTFDSLCRLQRFRCLRRHDAQRQTKHLEPNRRSTLTERRKHILHNNMTPDLMFQAELSNRVRKDVIPRCQSEKSSGWCRAVMEWNKEHNYQKVFRRFKYFKTFRKWRHWSERSLEVLQINHCLVIAVVCTTNKIYKVIKNWESTQSAHLNKLNQQIFIILHK